MEKIINYVSPSVWFNSRLNMRKEIVDAFPSHFCYCEPFKGTMSTLFYKDKSKIESLNDPNDDIVNFYEVVKDREKYKSLLKCVNNEITVNGEIFTNNIFDSYYMDLNEYDKRKDLSKIEFSYRFFYVLLYGSGYGPSTCYVDIFIENIYKRLESVFIEKMNYKDILLRYDRDHTFFYIDLPHILYDFDFVEFFNILKEVKGKFLLIGLSNDYIEKLFKSFFNINSINNEYIITNYDIEKCKNKLNKKEESFAMDDFFRK